VRTKVLTFIDAYLPGFKSGGPPRSVAGLVHHLGDEIEFWIVTSDRDFGDREPYSDVQFGEWRELGKAKVIYLTSSQQRLFPIARLMRGTQHDIIFLNSFFSPCFSINPLVAMRFGLAERKPLILAPRGELSDGALAIKRAKKRLFLAAARIFGLYRGIVFQASSVFEQDDIIRALPSIGTSGNIRIAPDLPRKIVAPALRTPRSPGEPLRIVFLSRISPMKNLAFALEVLREVKVPVRFTIYGPREDQAYWQQCEKIIEGMPPHIEIGAQGAIKPDDVIAILARHDLFFLPTRGENFGHVIAEALQAGLRLLLSDQTPWRGLASAGIGHDLPLSDPGPFVEAIEAEAARPPDSSGTAAIDAYLAKTWDTATAVRQARALFELDAGPGKSDA